MKSTLEKFFLEKLFNLLIKQNNCCDICKENIINFKTRGDFPLFIDHNHVTNKVRGLLCLHCNSALGFLKENIKIAKNIITYLEKHNNV